MRTQCHILKQRLVLLIFHYKSFLVMCIVYIARVSYEHTLIFQSPHSNWFVKDLVFKDFCIAVMGICISQTHPVNFT